MKKDTMTLEKAKKTPAGGVLVGKREGQTMIYDDATVGGYFVGKLHKEGGIKGINKATGQPIEVQSSEVIITAPAVADQTKKEFQGEMLTNREILSKINVSGGGVSFEQGGDMPSELYFNGTSYNYGGKTMTDYEIMQAMNGCGCEDEYEDGGTIITYKNKYNKKYGYSANESHNLEEIAKDTGISLKGLQQIYNKGIGAYKTNPESVRPNVKSKEQWAMARVYSAVMGGKASKIDANELKMNYGGQLNLMNESKKGDHTSRDLNNYNDVLDLQADGMVGSESGLFADGGKVYKARYRIIDSNGRVKYTGGTETGSWFSLERAKELVNRANGEMIYEYNYNGDMLWEVFATGGDVKPYDANMDGDSADTMYKEGGATLSAEVFEWDKVPTNYRNISKVKKVPFTNNPMDKGLDSIISPFLGKDDLRPSLTGINFDENGITATNAIILITLPYPNEKYNGVYDINKAKKQKSSELLLINENYPKYQNIIPDYKNAGTPYLIDVYKLLQYTKTAMNYANKITKAISFKFGDNEAIGFNGTLLSEVLTACLKLGHEKIYIFAKQNNRAIVLSPNKEYELGNDEILLTMPAMLTSTYGTITGYGTNDPDYNRSLKVYFDFNDSEIHNADGSVAEFKMQYENNLSVDDNYLALLSKMIKKNRINILEYVKVENGKMTATDLEISLIVKDVNMPNGIYEIVNNAPNITMNPIEDFPSERVFNKGEYETHWEQKRPTAFEFVTFSEVFEFYLDKLLLSVGKDDLRPVMSGICIKKTAQNEMFLVTTDAHTLCKINITEYCEFDKDSRELEYILPVKYLKDFVKLADGSLHFKCSMSNIFIEADNLDFIGRTIDGKYPNYDAVIPRDSTKKIVFDHVAMNKCLKSPEMTNLIAKYKGRKDILFDFFNIGNTLNIKVSERKSYNVQSELIEVIELCKIDFNYQEVESTLSLDQSAFLLMPSKDEFKENQYFSFRKEFFDVMLETITDTEVDCYFSEPNRPYVFPIDAIDYKKTLKVEKTKQQKLSKKDLEQIVELEDMKEVLESNELQEAIETLEMLIGTAKGKDKKDIKEALEILKMLQ